MNLDFLLFSAPKAKYNYIDFLGETIFIPAYVSQSSLVDEKKKGMLVSLANCYRANKNTEVYYSIDAALSDQQGEKPQQMCEPEGNSTSNSNSDEFSEYFGDEVFSHHIPCLFLSSMVNSKYLIIYFHASGEDIKVSHGLLNYIRNSYQVNVIAMEYPGYSIYTGSPDSEKIKKDARIVYDFAVKKLGFYEQNIIVMGRSVGTGVALELLKTEKQKKTLNPRCLVLISPFSSVKNLAKEFIGKLGTFLAKETYDNIENMQSIKCPVYIVHGRKDSLISFEQSQQLIKSCYTRKYLHLSEHMTHSTLDFYSDLVDPLREFLMEDGVNFYEQNMKGPVLAEELFQFPDGFKF